jgi:uncharacterized surface protein with fasciclin (FAS1) repeats
MKFVQVLPLAALGAAVVVPPEQVLNDVAIEDNHGRVWYEDSIEEKNDIISSLTESYEEWAGNVANAWNQVYESSKNALDDALDYAAEAGQGIKNYYEETAYDIESWLRTECDDLYDSLEEHDGPPHPPHRGRPGRPGRRPHHPHRPPHHRKSNLTVYQMISESEYTTELAKLINKYDDLVEALNSTKANYTVFAPTDKAFKKIPEHAPEPSKEQLKAILEYHVVDGFYPAGRVFASHTAPTLLKGEHLSSEPQPQRVAFKFGFRGLTVNFYSRIIAVNIFGTNGVIHGVDSILMPPPSALKIIDLLPGEFSTLELGLDKTGLLDKLNTTDHPGGTLFAPSNFAFKKLGPKINAFLFSQYGLKYLKALLEYHVTTGGTLYSDAFYKVSAETEDVPKGVFHVDLPTLLNDRTVAIDIARYGRFIEMKINAFARVAVQDGIAEDGVIHVVSDVIVPPKEIGRPGSKEWQYWEGEEMSVEELVERLEPFVAKSDL